MLGDRGNFTTETCNVTALISVMQKLRILFVLLSSVTAMYCSVVAQKNIFKLKFAQRVAVEITELAKIRLLT